MLPMQWQRSAFPRQAGFIFIIIHLTSITLLLLITFVSHVTSSSALQENAHHQLQGEHYLFEQQFAENKCAFGPDYYFLLSCNSYCLYPALSAFSSPSLRTFFWWSSLSLLCETIPKVALMRSMRPLSDLKKGTLSSLYMLFAHLQVCALPLSCGSGVALPVWDEGWKQEVCERLCPISCTRSCLKLQSCCPGLRQPLCSLLAPRDTGTEPQWVPALPCCTAPCIQGLLLLPAHAWGAGQAVLLPCWDTAAPAPRCHPAQL